MKKFLWFVILTVVVVKLSIYIASNQNYFLRKFDPVYMGNLYSQSQYVVGSGSEGIGDDGLYAFAGYYYLFKKGDVSAVNFEHPPLGKYLIGISILLFRNQNVINIIYFVLLLFITYKVGRLILKDKLLSLLAVAILSLDPLFLDHLLRSLLEIPSSLFVTLALYFFLRAIKNPKYYYLSFIFWGAVFSTRFFPFLLIIYLCLLISVFIYQKKHLIIYLKASFLVPFVYLLSHFSFFVYHPSLVEFLRHKKWMLSWFTGTPVIFGNIWRNIFSGRYINSTGELVSNEHWSILLPIIVFLSVTYGFRIKLTREKFVVLVVYIICAMFLIYLTVLSNGLQKFLMPIYPLLIILAMRNVEDVYSIIYPWCMKKFISKRS